jgi:Family of unknown function (DUF6502)
LSKKTSKTEALRTARTVFEALAPILVNHGVTSVEAESLLRSVVVHQAARVSKQYGQRPNASEVSVKTGLDRHTVTGLLRKASKSIVLLGGRRDPTKRVLEGWASNPAYRRGGRLRDLPVGDPHSSGNSAWDLVRRYAPGVWPRLVIEELIRLNYVQVMPKGLLRFKRSALIRTTEGKGVRKRSLTKPLTEFSKSFVDFLLNPNRGVLRTIQSVRVERSQAPLVRKLIRTRLDGTFAALAEELGSTRWRSRSLESKGAVLLDIAAFTLEQRADGAGAPIRIRKEIPSVPRARSKYLRKG